ncbi:MAG: hypothetical protein M1830_008312 [Pleopsidium flavum]|nr:MAG: hypothetical protein M1830_008312 [Pleopsidium flavum]
MAFKRKRSTSTFSPFSDSSCASPSKRESSHSPTLFHTFCSSDITMAETTHQIDNWTMTITEITPWHLHSRTRKRFRDSRPEESTVHKNTFQKLVSAQRSPSATPIPSLPQAPPSPSPSTSPTHHPHPQTSLLSFWALPYRPTASRPSPFTTPTSPTTVPEAPKCEDCDAPLTPTEAEALDVEMGGTDAESSYACRGCGREVCGTCAVMGDVRTCLQCATSSKTWLGGIGWMSPSVI